jgi:tetratricopeptide (TPR) repeat protein
MTLHRRAHGVFVAAHGERHPNVATVCDALGSDAADAGDHEEAKRWHEESLAIREATMPSDHPDLAIARHNLGNALHALGEIERAAELHLRSLRDFESTLGADHPYVGFALESSVDALVALGRLTEAKPLAARLLSLREGTPEDVDALAKAKAWMALAEGRSVPGDPEGGHTPAAAPSR